MIDATRGVRRARGRSPPIATSSRCCTASARDLQAQLAREGYRVRVYVPFGREWFPYFMRRLGERPANVGFVVRSLLRERLDRLAVSTASAHGDVSRRTLGQSPVCQAATSSPVRSGSTPAALNR